MTTPLVTGEDEFTRELETDHKLALWRVELSNGKVIVQDDNRPGVEPHSAWLRLAEHIRREGLAICRMWLQFRSNQRREILPANAEGYYFCKSALGMMNSNSTLFFYLVGYLQNGKLVVQRWAVPELLLVETMERDPAKAGECLIRNSYDSERKSVHAHQAEMGSVQ